MKRKQFLELAYYLTPNSESVAHLRKTIAKIQATLKLASAENLDEDRIQRALRKLARMVPGATFDIADDATGKQSLVIGNLTSTGSAIWTTTLIVTEGDVALAFVTREENGGLDADA